MKIRLPGRALLTLICLAAGPNAGKGVEIDVASVFPSSLPLIGEAAHELAARIEQASGGSLVLKVHGPDELVPAAEAVNAVADGRVAAAWGGAGWFASRDSAFNMFSSLPFGPGIGEYLAWMYHGGGLELSRSLFHSHSVHNIPCAIIAPVASGWFRKEIRTLADLRGLKTRFFGLGARVMEKVGVITEQLLPGEVLEALRKGEIDAAEFSLPLMDVTLGLEEAAEYYYFPGWHQQATFFDLYVHLDQWKKLTDQHKAIIDVACGDMIRAMIARSEATQWEALKALQRQGIQLKRWPAEILVALENNWYQVVREESAANPNFARVYKSYADFRTNYDIWRYLSYLD